MQAKNSDHCRTLYLELLKRSLSNTIYGDANISPGAPSNEYSVELRETGRDWPAVAHTMIGMKRLNNLQDCIERILTDKIPGDLIETGVWRGGAAILMRGVLEAYGDRSRVVWVADSFEGLPEPDPITYPADAGDGHHIYAALAVAQEDVEENFRRYGLLDERVRFVKGWFRDTLPALQASRFAVIRLDGDMYESTIIALESLYSKLSPGGFVIIDDYGAIEGCRRAVDDFRDAHCISDRMFEADWTGVYWMKTVADTAKASPLMPSAGTIDGIEFANVRANEQQQYISIPRGLCGTVHGWAVDATLGRLANRVLIQVDNLRPIRGTYGFERPDVAAAIGNDDCLRSGFRASFDTDHLKAGTHTVRAIAVASDGSWLPLSAIENTFIVEETLEDYVRFAPVTANGHVVIDEVSFGAGSADNTRLIRGAARDIAICGWAGDASISASASEVVAIMGSRVFRGRSGIERNDVARSLQNERLRHSGYVVEIPASAFVVGDNAVTLRALLPDGTCFESEPALHVVIDAP